MRLFHRIHSERYIELMTVLLVEVLILLVIMLILLPSVFVRLFHHA